MNSDEFINNGIGKDLQIVVDELEWFNNEITKNMAIPKKYFESNNDNYYPEPTCCICGKVCKIYEIHPLDKQMWVWCDDCEFDTFHNPINSNDNE